MSKAIIGDELWAEMTDGQKIEAVRQGHATLKQMSQSLLDGPDELRTVCQDILARTEPAFGNLPVEAERIKNSSGIRRKRGSRARKSKAKTHTSRAVTTKQRFGLPEDFVPRLQRYSRSVLLERNIYRLPNGEEFIPCNPTGTLGRIRHLYSLITIEQYLNGRRGSVYVRTDGRIFDYSFDDANPMGEIFDTGYTIYDLERTGRYAPERTSECKQKPQEHRRAASAR
jgi:hypothetical protein